MDSAVRIEKSLVAALAGCRDASGPSKLVDAMEYAVFPGGARVRPMLCLAVAQACGDKSSRMVLAAATSLELLHCASLVHDDLPCFDDANLRRGKPAVHRAFGEPIAVLAGDALIMLAISTLVKAAPSAPEKLAPILAVVTRAIGMPHGIIAGQAWESEPNVDVDVYHKSKTAALFVAACSAGLSGLVLRRRPGRRLARLLAERIS
jgi:geranylgeranyl diphosphate synthase type II